MKKIILVVFIIAVIVGSVMLLKKRKQSILESRPPAPPAYYVKVISAQRAELKQTRSFLAHLTASQTAEIASRLSGRIEKIFVQENDTVKKGDLLVQIDNRDLVSNIKSLQTSLSAHLIDVTYARSLYERNKALFEVGGLSREKLEASEVTLASKRANFEATQQKIAALKVQLSYLNITAPFSGIIGTLFLHTGDLAIPGRPLLSINSQQQKLTFSFVPTNFAIVKGLKVFVNGQETGQIENLYSDADNGLSVAEIAVSRPLQAPNNSYLTIDLLTFEGHGCSVPLNAILKTEDSTQVMVYAEKAFKPQSVTVIAENRDHVLIEPCPGLPIAVAAAAKLGLLPGYGNVIISGSNAHE